MNKKLWSHLSLQQKQILKSVKRVPKTSRQICLEMGICNKAIESQLRLLTAKQIINFKRKDKQIYYFAPAEPSYKTSTIIINDIFQSI